MVYAIHLVGNDVVKGVGTGPEDLVAEIFRRFWDPTHKLSWNGKKFGAPTTNGVVGLLKKALRNHFLDELKKSVYTHTEDSSANPGDTKAAGSDEIGTLLRVHLKQRASRVLAHARATDDAEVELYLELQLQQYDHGGKLLTNAEAAQELGVRPSDIVNIKKRIQRHA